MDVVLGYIVKCSDDIVPRITVQTFPNQNPWVNGEVRAKLKVRADDYLPELVQAHTPESY